MRLGLDGRRLRFDLPSHTPELLGGATGEEDVVPLLRELLRKLEADSVSRTSYDSPWCRIAGGPRSVLGLGALEGIDRAARKDKDVYQDIEQATKEETDGDASDDSLKGQKVGGLSCETESGS